MKRLNLFFICVLPVICAMAQRGGTELPGGMEELLHGFHATCINVEKAMHTIVNICRITAEEA